MAPAGWLHHNVIRRRVACIFKLCMQAFFALIDGWPELPLAVAGEDVPVELPLILDGSRAPVTLADGAMQRCRIEFASRNRWCYLMLQEGEQEATPTLYVGRALLVQRGWGRCLQPIPQPHRSLPDYREQFAITP